MSGIALIVIVVVLVAVFAVKSAGQVSEKAAREYLKNGALVIDVRSPEEFGSGHLPQAVNIPLDELQTAAPRRLKDKGQVLLLHCASGMRSGTAQKKLNRLGYTNAFNLGSYGRAEDILKQL